MYKYRLVLSSSYGRTIVMLALFLLCLPTSARNNNCCFVDRLCRTNDEWVSGYYAFHSNQCAPAVSAAASGSVASSQDGETSQNNNCCFSGWQCDTDDDWTSGYYAYQLNQCDSQSHWQALWQGPQSDAAVSTSSNRGRQAEDEPRRNGNPAQQQHRSNQGADENENIYESQRCTTSEDGTPVCFVRLTSWEAFWRRACSYYLDMREYAECR